jgi:hypothetical protein
MKAISKKLFMQKPLSMSQMQMPLCLELIIQILDNGQGIEEAKLFLWNSKRG